MNALVLIAHVIASHPGHAPAPIAGCSITSAERAAVIDRMDPADDDTLAAVADLLLEPDGASCLLDTWVLVEVAHAAPTSAIAPRALAVALASDRPAVAARAARLLRVLGVADPAAFGRVVRRAEIDQGALVVLGQELAAMPAGPRRAALVDVLGASPVAAR